jgi:RNA-binding protein YlmH
VFNVSRGEAQTAIKHGFVFVNFQPLSKRTQTLAPGQQLVFRTKGRAALASIELNPRSGRVWVEYYVYPS